MLLFPKLGVNFFANFQIGHFHKLRKLSVRFKHFSRNAGGKIILSQLSVIRKLNVSPTKVRKDRFPKRVVCVFPTAQTQIRSQHHRKKQTIRKKQTTQN